MSDTEKFKFLMDTDDTGLQHKFLTLAFANSVDLKKPTDLDLRCLPLSMWIYINNLDQIIWLAEN